MLLVQGVSAILLPLAVLYGIADAQAADIRLLTHDLKVILEPSSHHLRVLDRVELRAIGEQRHLAVRLNKHLAVARISHEGKLLSFYSRPLDRGTTGGHEVDAERVHEIVVDLDGTAKKGGRLVLDFDYAGELNDPPKEPRHLRFVTPSETSGHIGPEGVYIGPETAWYPDLGGSHAVYRATVTTPAKWETVGQGALEGREVTSFATTTTWNSRAPAQGLTLTAGQYLITTRNCDGIQIATYLSTDNYALAETYLNSACNYLRAYAALLGPYPFPRFSVVENFFASGLGLPSYTLLGSGSIRRRYVQPYALGHEIVHSWIGNYVYNDEGGNWVEGLTTYLANYYWYEMQGEREKARAERRMMLYNYAVYVSPEQDYAVARFKQKSDQRDNAIGYSKAAMVFHMLRREVGEEVFFRTLKKLITRYGGQSVGWGDLQTLFSDTASRDLRPFFTRWIEQTGALNVPQSADPDFNVFRRIPRADLPAMLNVFVTDPRRIVVHADGASNTADAYREIAERISMQDNVKMWSAPDAPGHLSSNSVLLLGWPAAGPVFEWAQKALPDGMILTPQEFRVGGNAYSNAGNALLLSIRNPDDPTHVVSIFYGLSPGAVKAIAPLLFFYGWNTYVVFENGKVIARSEDDDPPLLRADKKKE